MLAWAHINLVHLTIMFTGKQQKQKIKLENVKKITNLCALEASPGKAAMCRQMGDDALMGKITYNDYIERLEINMYKNKRFKMFIHRVLNTGGIKEKEVTSNGKNRQNNQTQ